MGKSYRDFDISLFGAVEQSDGSYIARSGDVSWYNEVGQLHREDGPAVIHLEPANGDEGRHNEWWLNGLPYKFKRFLEESTIEDEVKMILRLQYA